MARIVCMIGITHNPFHHRLISQPPSQWNEDTQKMVERGNLMREKLRSSNPQSLIMVGNDHFHQFFMDNMPAFILGKMELFDGIYYNEAREFNLPRCTVPGDVELAQQLLEGSLKRGVDFAFSNELKVDHSVVVPMLLVRPEMDLPIVPIMTNCVAPPLPPAERFYQVGKILREVIDEIPSDKRIGVVVSGNLSLEVGGPLQFDPKPMDEEFDDQAVKWISQGDIETALRVCTFDRMTGAGNVTHAFVNFLLAMALAKDMRCTYAEGLKRKGSTQPFFAWEP
jgi:protocatechuate 4,5-dioxygenase, beta chain